MSAGELVLLAALKLWSLRPRGQCRKEKSQGLTLPSKARDEAEYGVCPNIAWGCCGCRTSSLVPSLHSQESLQPRWVTLGLPGSCLPWVRISRAIPSQ
jgi:hypothetical protein